MHDVDVEVFSLFGEEGCAKGVEGARGEFEDCKAGFVDCIGGVRGLGLFVYWVLGGRFSYAPRVELGCQG